MSERAPTYEGPAILELMGHVRTAGWVFEAEIAGQPVLRLDIPCLDGSVLTQFYGASALYCLTPVSEEVMRSIAVHTTPRPVRQWELPRPALEPATAEDYAAVEATLVDECGCGHQRQDHAPLEPSEVETDDPDAGWGGCATCDCMSFYRDIPF